MLGKLLVTFDAGQTTVFPLLSFRQRLAILGGRKMYYKQREDQVVLITERYLRPFQWKYGAESSFCIAERGWDQVSLVCYILDLVDQLY